MKAIALSIAFEVASRIAFAQDVADPMAHLRACSLMERAERLECLDRLSRDIAPPDRPGRDGDNWVISETTSPINYAPIVTATVHPSSILRAPDDEARREEMRRFVQDLKKIAREIP